jgi:hypothetical protein
LTFHFLSQAYGVSQTSKSYDHMLRITNTVFAATCCLRMIVWMTDVSHNPLLTLQRGLISAGKTPSKVTA